MRINFISDVHLEFGDLEGLPGGDILILAGDILLGKTLYWQPQNGSSMWKIRNRELAVFEGFAAREFPKYSRVLAIAGNHEYYNGVMQKCDEALDKFYSKFGANYLNASYTDIYPNNSYADIEGVRFIGATLWTNFKKRDPVALIDAKWAMNDFKCIRRNVKYDNTYADRLFLPEDSADLHDQHLAAIDKHLSPTHRNVVISHHAPSFSSSTYNDQLTPAFCSDLSEFILDRNIDTWIHGHIHTTANYKIGDTSVRCNPRGYVGHSLNEHFQPGAAI